MCLGGGSTRTVVQKTPDPAPMTQVTNLGQGASEEMRTAKEQRKKRGQGQNAVSVDRDTILGALSGDGDAASRKTLG